VALAQIHSDTQASRSTKYKGQAGKFIILSRAMQSWGSGDQSHKR